MEGLLIAYFTFGFMYLVFSVGVSVAEREKNLAKTKKDAEKRSTWQLLWDTIKAIGAAVFVVSFWFFAILYFAGKAFGAHFAEEERNEDGVRLTQEEAIRYRELLILRDYYVAAEKYIANQHRLDIQEQYSQAATAAQKAYKQESPS